MPVTFLNPPGAPAPVGRYHHAAIVPPGMRLVEISGQVGVRADGSVVADPAAQVDQAFANLMAVIAGVGGSAADIVKLTTFLTDAAHVPVVRAARARAFGEAMPASTLLVVAGLAAPAYVFEVEATLALPG